MKHHIKVLTSTDRTAENVISYETSCGITGGKPNESDIARGLTDVTCGKCREEILAFWPQLRDAPPWKASFSGDAENP